MSSKKFLLSVFASGLWITFSEFLRNELLFKSYWTSHYAQLGITFPSEPINGIVWMLWSFVLAAILVFWSKKMTFAESMISGWVSGFVLMWLVTGNMSVLPFSILVFAIPLSLLEVFVALFIIQKMNTK